NVARDRLLGPRDQAQDGDVRQLRVRLQTAHDVKIAGAAGVELDDHQVGARLVEGRQEQSRIGELGHVARELVSQDHAEELARRLDWIDQDKERGVNRAYRVHRVSSDPGGE